MNPLRWCKRVCLSVGLSVCVVCMCTCCRAIICVCVCISFWRSSICCMCLWVTCLTHSVCCWVSSAFCLSTHTYTHTVGRHIRSDMQYALCSDLLYFSRWHKMVLLCKMQYIITQTLSYIPYSLWQIMTVLTISIYILIKSLEYFCKYGNQHITNKPFNKQRYPAILFSLPFEYYSIHFSPLINIHSYSYP